MATLFVVRDTTGELHNDVAVLGTTVVLQSEDLVPALIAVLEAYAVHMSWNGEKNVLHQRVGISVLSLDSWWLHSSSRSESRRLKTYLIFFRFVLPFFSSIQHARRGHNQLLLLFIHPRQNTTSIINTPPMSFAGISSLPNRGFGNFATPSFTSPAFNSKPNKVDNDVDMGG